MTAVFFRAAGYCTGGSYRALRMVRTERYERLVSRYTNGSNAGVGSIRAVVPAPSEQQCSNASSTQSGLSVIRYLQTAALSASFKLGNEVVDFMNAG